MTTVHGGQHWKVNERVGVINKKFVFGRCLVRNLDGLSAKLTKIHFHSSQMPGYLH
jgi:hypothetical protein